MACISFADSAHRWYPQAKSRWRVRTMKPITIEHRGHVHRAQFRVDGWSLEVAASFGTIRASLGLWQPELLARALIKKTIDRMSARSVDALARSVVPPQRVQRAGSRSKAVAYCENRR